MEIVFEFEEVSGGIFEKKRMVLDPGAGEPHAWLLVEGQFFRLSPLQELLPRFFRQERQTEMVGVNALLLWQRLRCEMGDELVPRESECDGVARLPTQRTTKSIDVELFRRSYIVRGKGQVKERVLHGNCSRIICWVRSKKKLLFIKMERRAGQWDCLLCQTGFDSSRWDGSS